DERRERAAAAAGGPRLRRGAPAAERGRLADARRARVDLAMRGARAHRVRACAPAGRLLLGEPALPAGDGGALRLGAARRAALAAADGGRRGGAPRDLPRAAGLGVNVFVTGGTGYL